MGVNGGHYFVILHNLLYPLLLKLGIMVISIIMPTFPCMIYNNKIFAEKMFGHLSLKMSPKKLIYQDW